MGGLPLVAAAPDGRFVVVWHADGLDGSGYGVFGRRFDAAGVPQGGEFQVNTYTTGIQARPGVTMDAAGNFVMVWQSYVDALSKNDVFARRYDSAGAPVGDPFLVQTTTAAVFGDQTFPAIDSDDAGNFVVVWSDVIRSSASPRCGVPDARPTLRPIGGPLGDQFTLERVRHAATGGQRQR